MKKYKVTLKGENYLLNLGGEIGKFGFFTTRFVKAKTPDEAQKIAKILVCHDTGLRDSIAEGSGPPVLKLERLAEINFFHFLFKKRKKGFEFHSEDEGEGSAGKG